MPRILLLIAVVVAVSAADPLPLGRSAVTLEVGGWERSAEVVRPTATGPLPVVIVLHGAGGSGAAYLEKNGWAALAASVGVLVVAPDGLPARPRLAASFKANPRLWNSGQLRPESPRAAIDDVAFLRALTDHLGERAPIDRRRVFAAGHSNGGGMSWRLAAEAPDMIAAIACMGGRVPTGVRPATRAVPAWMIAGALDPLNPLAGGERSLPWGSRETLPPQIDGLQAWAAAIGAPASAAVPAAPGLSEAVWGPGRDGAVLRWTVIAGHGHGWPGGQASGLSEDRIGPSMKTLDATPAIWAWFAGLSSK